MSHTLRPVVLAVVCAMALPATALAATTVPGQTGGRYDQDHNGFPDAGVTVVGHYALDDYYGCSVVVNYKGDFGNDPYLDSGVIDNNFLCKSGGLTSTYHYEIVSSDDPRYRGNPEWSTFGGTWEYHVLTQGGQGNADSGGNGNLVRPYKP